MTAVPLCDRSVFLLFFRRMRRKTRPAMRAIPRMGPTTAPAIQAFDLDLPDWEPGDGVGVEVITTPGDGTDSAALLVSSCGERR